MKIDSAFPRGDCGHGAGHFLINERFAKITQFRGERRASGLRGTRDLISRANIKYDRGMLIPSNNYGNKDHYYRQFISERVCIHVGRVIESAPGRGKMAAQIGMELGI